MVVVVSAAGAAESRHDSCTQVTGARTSGIVGMPGPWSSHKAGTPRGRPSQGTAGSIPRTGGHQPKDWQAIFFLTRSGSTVCPYCSWLTCPRSYVEFYSGLGAWYSCAYLCTPGFFSPSPSLPPRLSRLSIGKVQAIHWRWSSPWCWSGCLSPLLLVSNFAHSVSSTSS